MSMIRYEYDVVDDDSHWDLLVISLAFALFSWLLSFGVLVEGSGVALHAVT